MNELTRKVGFGAISGFVSAIVVDLDAWKKSNGVGFDYGLAVKRWIAGAITGALAGLGLGQTSL